MSRDLKLYKSVNSLNFTIKLATIKILIIFLIVIPKSSAQLIQFGNCSEVPTKKYFQIDKFLGKWYEIQRFSTWYELSGLCAYKKIIACERKVEVQHGFVRDSIQYVLHVNSSYDPGSEAVFRFLETNVDPVGIPLSVIETDYDNYAAIYGCKYNEDMNLRHVSAWILARAPTLEATFLKLAQDDLAVTGASAAHFETVEQDPEKCECLWTAHVYAENIEDRAGPPF